MCLSIRQTFFSFVPPQEEIFVGGPPRIFSSFVRFGDGHVLYSMCAHNKSISKYNDY